MHKLFLLIVAGLVPVSATVLVKYLHWHNEPYALSPELSDFERLLGVHNPSDERMMSIPDPPEDLPERRKAVEIAKKVYETYDNIRFLSFEDEAYEVAPDSFKLTASVVMGDGTLRSRISFDGKLLYELRWEDGQYYEHKLPFRGIPDQSVSYPISELDKRGSLQLDEKVPYMYGCLSAHIWHSWIGEGNKYIKNVCRYIARGRYLGVADVDGHRCFVIFKPAAWPVKYYVRCEDFLLAKRVMYRQVYWFWWTGYHVRRPVLRVRFFHNLRVVPKPGSLTESSSKWEPSNNGSLARSKLVPLMY